MEDDKGDEAVEDSRNLFSPTQRPASAPPPRNDTDDAGPQASAQTSPDHVAPVAPRIVRVRVQAEQGLDGRHNCVLQPLLPDQSYLVRVRCRTKAGWGKYSATQAPMQTHRSRGDNRQGLFTTLTKFASRLAQVKKESVDVVQELRQELEVCTLSLLLQRPCLPACGHTATHRRGRREGQAANC